MVTGRGRVPVLRRILRPHLAAVERADRTTGDDVAAAGGDERATEEHCAGYYCGAKIRHDNASTGIAISYGRISAQVISGIGFLGAAPFLSVRKKSPA